MYYTKSTFYLENKIQNIVSIKDFSISFNKGEFKALTHISFDIKKGETLGLVGESGSGKSLTSLALMGLLPKNAETNDGKLLLNLEEKAMDLNRTSEQNLKN